MSSDITTLPVEVDGVRVSDVFEPDSVEELQAFLTDASGPESVIVTGGRTRLAFGNNGGPFDVAVSLRRLNSVIHYEPDDMTMAVEPGCAIADIHRLLAEHNQAIALDVANDQTATIGGSFATGMSSPRRLGGGSLKDWAIGIEVVNPEGILSKAGGMVVKNVTGFDMMHVHYGALGAFGIVTRLNLKVFPRMNAARAVLLHFADVGAAHAAGEALLRSQLQPTSLTLSNQRETWQLAVRCDAPESAIERVVERVIEVATAIVPMIDTLLDADPDVALSAFQRVTDLVGQRGVVRLPIPASRQLATLRELEAANDFEMCADLGSGLIYAAGDPDDTWVQRIEELHPTPTFLALPAELKQGFDVFGAFDPAAAAVVRRMKDTYDPTRRLNRGRFVAHL